MRVLPELVVNDPAEAVGFFEDILAFEVVRVSGVGTSLQCRLRYRGQDLIVRSGEKRIQEVMLHFFVEDLSEVLVRLQQASRQGQLPYQPRVQRSFFGLSEISIRMQGYVLRFHQQSLPVHPPTPAKPRMDTQA